MIVFPRLSITPKNFSFLLVLRLWAVGVRLLVVGWRWVLPVGCWLALVFACWSLAGVECCLLAFRWRWDLLVGCSLVLG